MSMIQELKEKVQNGRDISKEEALVLYDEPLEELCQAADEIRRQFAMMDLISVRLLTEKAGDVPKTASTAPSPHITALLQKNIRFLAQRRL